MKPTYRIESIQERKQGILITINSKEYLLNTNQFTDHFLYPGKELSIEEFHQLSLESKEKKTNDYLTRLLSSGRYTCHELVMKLQTKYALSTKEAMALLSPYLENGIIDDFSYARDYIEAKLEQGYGKNYILDRLKKKGISKDILEKEEIHSFFDDSPFDMEGMIAKMDRTKKDKTIEQRKELLLGALLRRGFSSHESKEAVEAYFSSFNEEEKQKEEENRRILIKREFLKCYNALLTNGTVPRKKRDTIIRKLLLKGFRYDEIINEMKEYEFHD